MLKDQLLDIFREIRFRTPLRRFSFYRYDYMFSPRQLGFLLSCIEKTEGVPGAVVEIGCAAGRTTVWLNKALDELSSQRDYVCVDTFSGFTDEDIATEVSQRGKPAQAFSGFRVNKKAWFDQTMLDNEVSRVRSYTGDINHFDLARVASPISFCLVDVDLYRPVKSALAKVLPLMSPGGIIVIDDCKPNNQFDGALQAYEEFVREKGLPTVLTHGKLGVIEIAKTAS